VVVEKPVAAEGRHEGQHGRVGDLKMRIEIFPDDLDAFVDFYTRVLRFDLERDERGAEAEYVSVRRGQVHIGAIRAWSTTNPAQRLPPQGTEIVFEVDDVDAEREAVVEAGWDLFEDLVERPWGLRDFRLLDADGNFLRFTSR